MNITLRNATIEDAAQLAENGDTTFRETWSKNYDAVTLNNYLDATYSFEVIRKELSDPMYLYIVAFDNEKMVGFAKLSRQQQLGDFITRQSLEICRLYVLKAYHDQKVGKLLMEATIELAKKEDMESVVLGVWEDNHRAVAFYKKWGFEKIGTHPFVMGDLIETDWVMEKKLV
jgi:ribosomal protein S18 acetylase RimI-like enzyme